jgi:hypothetical protein
MPSSAGPTYVHLSRRGWVALASLLILPWLLLLWFVSRQNSAPSPSSAAAHPIASAAPAPTRSSQYEKLPTGPWGKLEFSRILIEPPSEFIPVAEEKIAPPRWVFHGYTDDKLRGLWARAALTSDQAHALATARRETAGDAVVLFPEPEVVIALAPQARATIYAALAEYPENAAQCAPFRLRAELAEEWFDHTGLPADVIALTKRLLYPRATGVNFSDQDIVLPRLSALDRVRFLKTLSRKSVLLVRLQVDQDSDPDALATYWGRGRRSKDVRPLLQSLVRHAGGANLDIVHLLPPFPRALLYTYPLPSDQPAAAARDCHWTSFNFFREEPDERFGNIDYVKQTLLNGYYPVLGEPMLGDVLVMVQPNGVVVHSCVYIAADIVFTKNGASYSVPWTLAPLDQVVAFYSLGPPLEVRRFRLKDS